MNPTERIKMQRKFQWIPRSHVLNLVLLNVDPSISLVVESVLVQLSEEAFRSLLIALKSILSALISCSRSQLPNTPTPHFQNRSQADDGFRKHPNRVVESIHCSYTCTGNPPSWCTRLQNSSILAINCNDNGSRGTPPDSRSIAEYWLSMIGCRGDGNVGTVYQ